MTSYIVRRLIQTVIVIALLSYVCYFLLTLMPGDPVEMLTQSNPRITSADVDRLRRLYGLDQPTYVRYWNWVSTIASGDLGYSRTYRVPVSEIMVPKLLNTFILSMTALLVALLISIPLGIWAALHPGTRVDYFIGAGAFLGISLPSFWLGILFIIFFAVKLGWLPAGGTFTVGLENSTGFETVLDRLKYLFLPALSLCCLEIGIFLRFTRSAMLEAMRNDYIRTAKAKGLSFFVIIWRHGFRNALLPLITIIALNFATVFSGATITETVFAYQGVGKLVYDSIIGNDFPVAMVSFMISVSMVLVFNLIADIMYGFADPRISFK